MIDRIFCSVIVLLAILFCPYWIYLPLLFVVMLYLPFYWEGILLAALIDFLYGNGLQIIFYAPILLLVLLPIKERLRVL